MKVVLLPSNVACAACGYAVEFDDRFRGVDTPMVCRCVGRDCPDFDKPYVYPVTTIELKPAE